MLIFKQQNSCRQLMPFFKPHQIFYIFLLVFLLQGCTHTLTKNMPPAPNRSLPAIRALQVDLDYVYDPDPDQQSKNLELLTGRVNKLGVNTVFLQAFADPDGNGVAESLYFPSSVMPLQADLFASTARALRKNGVAVYGWLPMLAYRVPEGDKDLYVAGASDSDRGTNKHLRLSPFNARAREIIERIYRDFASQTTIDGILFHDDGVLSDSEDSSQAALQQYKQAGFPPDIKQLQGNREMMRQWSRYKTTYLIDFSLSLLEIIRQQQPGTRSARNIFAGPVLNPESETWFAQSLPLFLQAYDYTAVMAMPFMEKAALPDRWLERLSWAALDPRDNSNRIIFELQAKDWRTDRPVAAEVLQRQITLLARMGVTSFAYYPDDFHKNMPPAHMIKTCLTKPKTCAGESGR